MGGVGTCSPEAPAGLQQVTKVQNTSFQRNKQKAHKKLPLQNCLILIVFCSSSGFVHNESAVKIPGFLHQLKTLLYTL